MPEPVREQVYEPAELSLTKEAPVTVPPAGTGCSLWWADVAAQRESAAALAPLLDDGERRRAAAFHQEADRHRYLVAHVALRQLLGAALGLAPQSLRFVRLLCPCCDAPHGRPALADGRGPHFSLSHSGDLVLLALCARPVGVDVEQHPAPNAATGTLSALHPREQAELRSLPQELLPAAFTRTWARKEAYLKGLGTGLGRSPALDYVGTGPVPAPAPAGWALADVAVRQGYAGAVAVQD